MSVGFTRGPESRAMVLPGPQTELSGPSIYSATHVTKKLSDVHHQSWGKRKITQKQTTESIMQESGSPETIPGLRGFNSQPQTFCYCYYNSGLNLI
jgi:hypothetical protein